MTATALGLADGRRLARHPLVVFGAALALFLIQLGLRGSPGGGLAALTQAVPFYLGPATFIAGWLMATRDRRAGTAELVAATPASARTRALGLLLAIGGPVVVAVALTAGAALAHLLAGLGGPPVAGPGDLISGPLVVCCGGALGVATGRKVSFRGAPAVVLAGLVAWCVLARDRQLLTPYVELIDPATGRRLPGSMAWHDAFLACLGLLAAVAALPSRPTRWPLLLGAAALLGAVLSAWRLG